MKALLRARPQHAVLLFAGMVSVLLTAATTAQVSAQENSTTATILDGVFTAAQAVRGKTVYSRNCQNCHASNLQGEGIEPPLIDTLFIDAWREDKLFSLYDFIATRMPKEGRKTTPGSLTAQQTLDVLAYILQRNGFSAGAAELQEAQLTTTQFVGHQGPMPLPQSAMVRFVGCLQQTDNNYQLLRTTEPARVRVSDETDAHEIAQSQAIALGNNKVPLTNVSQLANAPDVVGFAGQKVQAKGVLNLHNDGYSLHVLSLVALSSECPMR